MVAPIRSLQLVLLLPFAVRAANDWATPCFNGACSYTKINNDGGHSLASTLHIAGTDKAISDLTTAAGWTILDCDAGKMGQNIRAVCTGKASDCNHLYQGNAVGTVVRLPESCGKMAFARVASEWEHKDQSLPADVEAKIQRRDTRPTVRGLAIDTNFAAVDPSQNGNVTMFLQGSTSNNGNFTVAPPAGLAARHWWDDIIDDVLEALSFNIDISKTQNINYDKPYTLLDQSISCPANGAVPSYSASINVNVEARANAAINYGLAAVGSIIPPEIDDFGLFCNLDAQLDGILNVAATANAAMSSGTIPIWQYSLPGFDFDGILSMGASFGINAEADASIDANANVNVDLAYTVSGARLFFPPSKGSSGGVFTPADTHLSLTATPGGSAHGTVGGSVYPTVGFSVNAFGGVASAGVNLDVTASARADLSLSASGVAGSDVPASGSFSGCVDVNGVLNVNAGANADFLGLWDPSTSVSLFDKNFDIYSTCFGSSKREEPTRKHSRDLLYKRGLTCPSSPPAGESTIVSTTLAGSSIKAM